MDGYLSLLALTQRREHMFTFGMDPWAERG